MSSESELLHGRKVGLVPKIPAPPLSASAVGPQRRLEIGLQARLPGLLQIVDWLSIVAVGLAIDIALIRLGVSGQSHYLEMVFGATATVNFLHVIRGYCVRGMRRVAVQITKVSLAWVAAFTVLATIGYLADSLQYVWDAWAAIWFGSVWLFLCATRWAAGCLLLRWQWDGRLARNVAVLGAGPAAVALERRLRARPEEVNVVGVFTDGGAAPGTTDITRDREMLTSLLSSGHVDEVVLALPFGATPTLNRTLAEFTALPVEVKIDPGLWLSGVGVPLEGFSVVAGVPTLIVQGQPLAGWGAPLKRAEDIVLTCLLLAVLSPLLLLIALLIKLDSRGPVIFRQERHGFNNQRISVLKFRSMHHHANPDSSIPQAQRNDPRITRVGAFLRRTSLDELPQLINVLRGDMSLVGPRPHATSHNEKYARLIDRYLVRHRMKPGITGWAQVNGWRGETETVEKMRSRLEHDLYYIANWSLLMDVKILLLTIPVIIRGTNAW